MFEKIKYYYEKGLYNDKHLYKLLTVGAITQEQHDEIKKADVFNG